MVIFASITWDESTELVFKDMNEFLSFAQFIASFGNKPLQGILINTYTNKLEE